METIRIWNRAENREHLEPIFGEAALRAVYSSHAFSRLLASILSRPVFSRFYGIYQSSFLSRRSIDPFVRQFQINMGEFEDRGYRTFNDFFARRFRDGARKFIQNPGTFPAFAEGRLLAYASVQEDHPLPVKGGFLRPTDLLGSEENTACFSGGPCIIIRLCPQDYHRFHFPDSGRAVSQWRIPGSLHSVSLIALSMRGGILNENERCITLLETEHFGNIAFVEVGAMFVGKIIQVHPPVCVFNRGDEKGYFEFGASTVIVLGEAGKWMPDKDLIEKTKSGWETLVQLGEAIGQATSIVS
jgi:phosphatidylserine decarboxylase